MGFGSYDESEQKDNDVDADDSEGVAVHENDHDGSVSFETEATTSEKTSTNPITSLTPRRSSRNIRSRTAPVPISISSGGWDAEREFAPDLRSLCGRVDDDHERRSSPPSPTDANRYVRRHQP